MRKIRRRMASLVELPRDMMPSVALTTRRTTCTNFHSNCARKESKSRSALRTTRLRRGPRRSAPVDAGSEKKEKTITGNVFWQVTKSLLTNSLQF